MLDGYIHDLEPGDVFRPVVYTVTAHMAAAYAHGSEDITELYQSSQPDGRPQIRPATAIHSDKMRLLEANCLKERRLHNEQGTTTQRVHYEYEVQYHSIVYVGDELEVTGKIVDKYERRGRLYLAYEIEVKTTDGRPIASYKDRTLLGYKKKED